jgi:hypothetical protein
MGWTTCNKPRGITPADFLARDAGWTGGRAIVGKASAPGAVYLALRIPAEHVSDYDRKTFIPAADGSITTALVYLVSRGEGARAYYNFGYKDMTESMGPVISTAPARFLALLSPIRPEAIAEGLAIRKAAGNDWSGNSALSAHEWRERCGARATVKANRIKLTDGLKVVLPYNQKFTDGRELNAFTVRTMKRRGRTKFYFYHPETGNFYRLGSEARNHLRLA